MAEKLISRRLDSCRNCQDATCVAFEARTANKAALIPEAMGLMLEEEHSELVDVRPNDVIDRRSLATGEVSTSFAWVAEFKKPMGESGQPFPAPRSPRQN